MRIAVVVVSTLLISAASAWADAPAHEFLDDAKALLVVGACAEGTTAAVKEDVYTAHCKAVRAAQDEYKTGWIAPAREFFAAHVPAAIPKTVDVSVRGGDLSTALTVFPDAEEITTLVARARRRSDGARQAEGQGDQDGARRPSRPSSSPSITRTSR